MNSAPAFPGVDVPLQGVTFVLPRLSFAGFGLCKELLRRIAEGQIADPVELQNAFIDVLHIGFKRNYPEMERQLLEEALDWDVAPGLLQQLLTMSMPRPVAAQPVTASVEPSHG